MIILVENKLYKLCGSEMRSAITDENNMSYFIIHSWLEKEKNVWDVYVIYSLIFFIINKIKFRDIVLGKEGLTS